MKWRSGYTAVIAGLLLAVLAVTLYLGTIHGRPTPIPPVTEITPDESGDPGEELAPIVVKPGDWPTWRGPPSDRKNDAPTAPTAWAESKNVAWKVPVAGRGHSSPVLWGERIFLTTADESAQVQSILCFDRATGKELWSVPAYRGGLGKINAKNSHASATPACDGERVIVPFLNGGAIRVTATDLNGAVLWQTEAGAFNAEHGYGSSPVFYKSLVIVSGDSPGGGFLAALHRKTGKIVWRVRRPASSTGSYGTPALVTVEDRPQLVLAGCSSVCAYDPANGKQLWSCPGPSQVAANTIAFDSGLFFASGGYPEKEVLAIRPGGDIAWRSSRGVAYVPSPLAHGGLAYLVQDGPGLLTCFRGATGEVVWKERLRGNFTASPALTHDYLYLANEEGRTFVIKAGPKFELVAENDLEEGCLASPAFGGGQVFLRTAHHLYCIGSPRPPVAETP
jgi:outer membrane protein assembly factor BamB